MPTYLVHGFRWSRALIRIHIILQDLEDAAAEWIIAPATSITLLNSFYTLYDFLPPCNPPPLSYELPVPHEKVLIQDEKQEESPKLLSKRNLSVKGLRRISSAALLKGSHKAGGRSVDLGMENQRPKTSAATNSSTSTDAGGAVQKTPGFNDWSVVKLLEQYDPEDLVSVSQPYAYVADHMIEISLSASLTEESAKYEARVRAEEELLAAASSAGEASRVVADGSVKEEIASPLSPREQRRRTRRLGWLEKLRDGLEKDSEIGWFVVVCGDEERAIPSTTDTASQVSIVSREDPQKTPTRSGLRNLFRRKKSSKESKA